ncbi:MAG: type II toxin-antitoxin system Phd/YefM family antitoxin [Anaerolineae bacterium]
MEARIVGVTELQRHCRRVIDEVVDQGRPVILTRGSRPAAVIVSYEEYVREREEREKETLARVDRMLAERAQIGDQVSEEEAMAIALEEVHAVREARRKYEAAREGHEERS